MKPNVSGVGQAVPGYKKKTVKLHSPRVPSRETSIRKIVDALFKAHPNLEGEIKDRAEKSRIVELLLDSWAREVRYLDEKRLALYSDGLSMEQGKGFNEIFRFVHDAGYILSTRTLEKHLEYLHAVKLVERNPRTGGRGVRVKYHFQLPRLPPEIPGAMSGSALRVLERYGTGLEVQMFAQLGSENIEKLFPQDEAKELAGRFWRIRAVSNVVFLRLLERMVEVQDRDKAFELFSSEREEIEEMVSHTVWRLIRPNSSHVKEAVSIYDRWLRGILVVPEVPARLPK
jgi:hypothetical protein